MKAIVLAILLIAPAFIVAPCSYDSAISTTANTATGTCRLCVAKTATAVNGESADCSECHAGHYLNGASPNKICSPCPINNYATAGANSACNTCPNNKQFTGTPGFNVGFSSCTNCPANQGSVGGQTCAACLSN